MILARIAITAAIVGCAFSASLAVAENAVTADLVVYGGTASGVMAAYAAARDGLKVVLLEPDAHLGGMVTGGLSATDTGNFSVIGGYVRDFYREAAAHYGVNVLDRREDWLLTGFPQLELLLACATSSASPPTTSSAPPCSARRSYSPITVRIGPTSRLCWPTGRSTTSKPTSAA